MFSRSLPQGKFVSGLVAFLCRGTVNFARRRRRTWILAEVLEPRTLPTVSFSVTFDDPEATQAAFYTDLEQNVLAAGDTLAQYFEGTSSIEVVVEFSLTAPTANGGCETVVIFGLENELSLVQSGAASEIRTGVDPNGADPDIRITIGVDYLTEEVWLDPTPFDATDPVPAEKVDGYSVLLHELVHALSFIGYGDDIDGSLSSEFATLFDRHVTFVDGNFYFNGPQAVEFYGGPVPLTFGNHFHVGNDPPRPGSELLTDLMNGVIGYRGVRDIVSPLDLAIMSDTEIPMLADVEPNNPPEILPQAFEIAEHSANGTVVATVFATDPDLGQTKTFAILSGNSAGAFSINPASGMITVADGSVLEFDTQESYLLSVEVTDNGIPTLTSTADITINLVERTIPRIVTSSGSTTLSKRNSVIIDALAVVEIEPDFTDPEGSKLKVSIAAGVGSRDQLIVSASKDPSTRLKLKKGELKKGKTTIATTTGGTGGSPLEFTFLSTATVGDVELVLKKVALKVSRKEVGTRTVMFQFYLADGAMGDAATKSVVIP